MSTEQYAHEQPEQSKYFDELRLRMVQLQLRSRGVADERVLQAMGMVPREEFVSDSVRDYANDDCPLSALAWSYGQSSFRIFAAHGKQS